MDENELYRQIGHALRQAAGLPYEENPFVLRPDEAHLPPLEAVVGMIEYLSVESEILEHPSKVAGDLAAIRQHLKKLRMHVTGLDDMTIRLLEHFIAPERVEYSLDDATRNRAETLSYFEQLESAVAKVEGIAENERKRPPVRGPRKIRERSIAHCVAYYVKRCTGALPKLSRRGSEPTGPYGRALCEIFVLFGLSPGSFQRAGEWAINNLKSQP